MPTEHDPLQLDRRVERTFLRWIHLGRIILSDETEDPGGKVSSVMAFIEELTQAVCRAKTQNWNKHKVDKLLGKGRLLS